MDILALVQNYVYAKDIHCSVVCDSNGLETSKMLPFKKIYRYVYRMSIDEYIGTCYR